MKWNRVKNSPRWFSIGVPVVISRNCACRCMAACDRRVVEFLIAWASSRTTVCQATPVSRAASWWSRP